MAGGNPDDVGGSPAEAMTDRLEREPRSRKLQAEDRFAGGDGVLQGVGGL